MRRRTEISANGSMLGLDLSLTATGMCALPMRWDHNLASARVAHVGSELPKDATPRQRIERIAEIVDAVLAFSAEHDCRAAYVEDFAFGLSGFGHGNRIAEMTGAVKHALYRMRAMVVTPINSSRARKVLIQRVPRADVKKYVQRNVKRLGGVTAKWTGDEIDAFVICNAGLMLSGGVAMTFPGEE